MPCPVDVHKKICEQATIRITPDVTIADVKTFCIGDPEIGPCPGKAAASCDITVHQKICVDIDLKFDANATVVATALVCGIPSMDDCPCEPHKVYG